MSADTIPAQAPEVPASTSLPTRIAVRRDQLRLTRWAAFAGVALLVAVSVVLRTRALHFHFWVDEGISVGIASHPLSHIPSLLRQDGAPPLYYLLLHLWMSAFGHSEVVTHELSLVFALLTIPAAYWAGTSLFGRRVGLIAAGMAALVPYLTTYAQETRMYALVAFLVLIATAAFVHAFVFRRRRYVPVFAVSLAASLYTHNWALFFGAVTLGVFAFCVFRTPAEARSSLLLDGALGFGAAAVLYAPWLPTLLYQSRHTGAPWDLPPVLWSLSQGLYSLVGGRGAAIALLLGGGSGLLALRQVSGPAGRRIGLAALSLLALGLGTLVLAWAYSKLTPAWADRYLAVVLGPLLLAFALGASRGGRLGLVALLLVACFWILDPMPSSVDSKSNVAITMSKMRHHLGADPLVLSTQPEQVPVISYYLPRVTRFLTPLGTVPDPRVMDWRDALKRFHHHSVSSLLMPLVQQLGPGARILLVTPLGMAKTPKYFKLINQASVSWSTALAFDRALKRIKVTDEKAYSSGVAVRAVLYEVRPHRVG